MSTDLKAIMARDERRRRMINDPDLGGDLLLFALCLDEVIVESQEQGRKRVKNWVRQVGELAQADDSTYRRFAWGLEHWVKQTIRSDAPRYEAADQHRRIACVAPMIRREGLCGKGSTHWLVDHDPVTGEATAVGLCTRHYRALNGYYSRRATAWQRNGGPLPAANRGGVLRRYFNVDWDEFYRWSGREPMAGGREATPPRPKLRLIQGGEDSEVES